MTLPNLQPHLFTEGLAFVAGYPKSGTTWLTRLMGEIWKSSTGGSHPSDDHNEIATQARPGRYVFRKGHYMIMMRKDKIMVANHLLGASALFRPIAFVYRDPRAIIVSGTSHWKNTLDSQHTFLEWMLKGSGGLRSLPPWDQYMFYWMAIVNYYPNKIMVSYEELSRIERKRDWLAFQRLAGRLGLSIPTVEQIEEGFYNQSFTAVKQRIRLGPEDIPQGKEFQLNFMREGKPDGWRESIDQEVRVKAENRLALLLDILRYK